MSTPSPDAAGPEQTRGNGPGAGRSVLKVFLFTDLVDSTSWKKTLGDRDYAMDVLAPHDRLCRTLIAEYPGASLNNDMGDGYLATFPAPGDAVGFALRFHAALAREPWGESVGRSGRLPATRIGIHLGEHIELDQPGTPKLSGQAVDLAARVMGLGQPGQTLLTRHAFDSARQYVRGNPVDPATPLAFVAHGRYRFKGNEDDPLEIFGVAAEGSPTLAPPPDSEKAKRVKVDEADDTGSWRPAVGQAIPRRDGWLLEKQIGEGGFGEVWLARHKRTKERRVFKFCFDADRLRSFKRELTFFKLIQRELGDRPDLVKLFEVQVEKPPYFLESEYVPDGDLGHWLDQSGGFDRWPLPRRLMFLTEVARAVAAAHSLGIIHKDLKPSNILVRPDAGGVPHPVLTDFGIGVLADRSKLEQGNITETGFTESMLLGNDSSRTGTRLYAPPESQLGKSATTGTDVYALGVMLYQFAAAQLKEPLGVGWEEKIDAGDPDRTDLLRGDIRAATYALPEKRLPAAVALAERLETLDARVAERKAAAEREAVDRRRAERVRKARTRRRVLAGLAVLSLAVSATAYVGYTRSQAVAYAERLLEAPTADVPRLIPGLHPFWADGVLKQAADGEDPRRKLNASLALLPRDPAHKDYLVERLHATPPAEVAVLVAALKPHANAPNVGPPLWAVLTDPAADHGRKALAASALAGLVSDDPRWPEVAADVVEAVVQANPVEFVAWSQALEPVRRALLPALLKRYPRSRDLIRGGKLDESKLVAEASGFDLTANLLARYTADRPADLAEMAVTVDARHHTLFAEAISKNRAAVVPLLTAEMGKSVTPPWADPPPNPAWVAIPEASRQAVEAGEGFVHDRFAIVQAVPLTEFDPLAKSLTPSGYRPVRVRPYATGDGLKVAALWRRDGVGWKLASGLTGEELRVADDAARGAGFQPGDVAGWVDAEAKPRPVEPLAAALGGAAGWAAAHAPTLRFTAVWEPAPAGKAVSRMYMGLLHARHNIEMGVLIEAKLNPLAIQAVATPDGRRYSGIWGRGGERGGICDLGRTPAAYLGGVSGLPPAADMTVIRGQNRETQFSAVWHEGISSDTEQPTGLTAADHLGRCRELAAEGWRPVAIGVADADLAASVWHRPAASDAALSGAAARQANAVAVLLTLGEAERAWPVFKHAPDPTARSYLVHRAAGVGVDPNALVGRFRAETDVSAKRALLLAIGEFPATSLPAGERAGLTAELLTLFKDHPDPGLHGAIDWLLRQKWGKAAELVAIDADLAGRAKGGDPGKSEKNWFVNGEGQTFAAIRGPVEFTLGSPVSEPDRDDDEPAHRKRIGRSFAVATREVTVAEFLRFRPTFSWVKRYSPDRDSPAVSVTWYQAAAYCNWLSEKAGILEEQWCYEPNEKKEYGEGMTIRRGHLGLTGYRLPTEAEWEYACRAGTGTARYFGRPDGLLPFYAWGLKNADDRAWPVGRLKPNDLGLFDALGNALEWVGDPGLVYATGMVEDSENVRYIKVNEQSMRLSRGCSYFFSPAYLRCAFRTYYRPSIVNDTLGFRLARTILR